MSDEDETPMESKHNSTGQEKPETESKPGQPATDEPSEEKPTPDNEVIEDEKPAKKRPHHRLIAWCKANKKISIPVGVLVILLLLFAIPLSRYQIAGLFLKKNYTVKVVDSVTSSPVSGADVSTAGKTAVTDGNGNAKLSGLKVGHHAVSISKKYYQDRKMDVLVPILSEKKVPSIAFEATGRPAKITVTNVINHQALAGVDISVADTEAKTDKSGNAIVVLPTGKTNAKATLSLNGYNKKEITINISDQKIEENNVTLTPSGKIYFLSKLSGKIDVVKTDLDGASRSTVLAGTGKEEDTGTVLLAARDWKYLALQSRRDSEAPRLYLIDTSNDAVTTIDEGNAIFTPVGWNDNNFVFITNRSGVPDWQAHAQALKTFNAQTKQLTILDQTAGQGTNQIDYARENYGQVYIIGKNVIYEKSWQANTYYVPGALDGKQAGIYSINISGQGFQTFKNFSYASGKTTYFTSIPYEAQGIYYQVTEKNDVSYYAYASGKITGKDDLSDTFNNYYQKSVTYLQSPSGNETFWSDPRDGKNTLFVGGQNGEDGKQIAALSDYTVYGWFSDNYLLVSKNSSELFIMPKTALPKDTGPLKITDYHKPARTFPGYGGGYGGV